MIFDRRTFISVASLATLAFGCDSRKSTISTIQDPTTSRVERQNYAKNILLSHFMGGQDKIPAPDKVVEQKLKDCFQVGAARELTTSLSVIQSGGTWQFDKLVIFNVDAQRQKSQPRVASFGLNLSSAKFVWWIEPEEMHRVRNLQSFINSSLHILRHSRDPQFSNWDRVMRERLAPDIAQSIAMSFGALDLSKASITWKWLREASIKNSTDSTSQPIVKEPFTITLSDQWGIVADIRILFPVGSGSSIDYILKRPIEELYGRGLERGTLVKSLAPTN